MIFSNKLFQFQFVIKTSPDFTHCAPVLGLGITWQTHGAAAAAAAAVCACLTTDERWFCYALIKNTEALLSETILAELVGLMSDFKSSP